MRWMRVVWRGLLPAVLMGLLGACTTVNRGVTDYLFVDTVPQGARVTISEMTKGKPADCPSTPCVIPRPRSSEFIVTISHEGHEPFEMLVTHSTQRASLNGTLIGNTMVGGLTVATAAAYGAAVGEAITLGFGGSGASSAAAAGAIPVAGGLVAGMALVDVTSGAGQNLFPNPIVLELAPEGSERSVQVDPRVALFEEQLVLEEKADRVCGHTEARFRSAPCASVRSDLTAIKRQIREETRTLFTVITPPPQGTAAVSEQ